MRLTQNFHNCKFPPEVIKSAASIIQREIRAAEQEEVDANAKRAQEAEERHQAGGESGHLPYGYQYFPSEPTYAGLTVSDERGSWELDHEAEWFVTYRNPQCGAAGLRCESATYNRDRPTLSFSFSGGPDWGTTSITVSSHERSVILETMDIFEGAVAACTFPEIPGGEDTAALHGFMGHGGSPSWRELRDALVDQHGYQIEVFESGSRAGHGIRDVLESAVSGADYALLVLTGEDVTADNAVRARQNVVHEVGLFQGRLGWSRAILVVEDGIELMSNLDGVQQVRFPRGSVLAAVGGVLAALRREFGDRR